MISKNKQKYIRSLELKKYRNEEQAFVAEGTKLVGDMLPAFSCRLLVATPEWFAMRKALPPCERIEVSDEELRKVSFQKNPQEVLAVFSFPQWNLADTQPGRSLTLALDGIQDPGNMGTIIRLADWFGIEHIVCSTDTVDVFNPKTVQATMGALSRVQVHYTDLPNYLQTQRAKGIPLYGTFLDGENMYEKTLTPNGILVMGNEGNGVRPEVERLIDEKLYIPSFPPERETSESLNVAIATSIVCAEFRRRITMGVE